MSDFKKHTIEYFSRLGWKFNKVNLSDKGSNPCLIATNEDVNAQFIAFNFKLSNKSWNWKGLKKKRKSLNLI